MSSQEEVPKKKKNRKKEGKLKRKREKPAPCSFCFLFFFLFFFLDVVSALGLRESIPIVLAAWAPAGISALLGLAMVFHLEDG